MPRDTTKALFGFVARITQLVLFDILFVLLLDDILALFVPALGRTLL
jgi:hypothetical protein